MDRWYEKVRELVKGNESGDYLVGEETLSFPRLIEANITRANSDIRDIRRARSSSIHFHRHIIFLLSYRSRDWVSRPLKFSKSKALHYTGASRCIVDE